MRKLILAASLTLAVFVPGVAASTASVSHSVSHVRQYERDYSAVAAKFGHRAPGRNIVKYGFSQGKRATDAQIVTSIGVLERMLAPPAPTPVATPTAVTTSAPQAQSVTPSGGLAACIVSRESGGNPQATNGQYTGIAQWSPSSWAGGGGTQYAPTPTGASAADQMKVLNHMLASGQASQWTPYDGC